MRNVLLVICCAVLLGGCASMNFGDPERWVENNTVYSSKLPSLEFKVSDELVFAGDTEESGISTSTTGYSNTGKTVLRYRFRDPLTTNRLLIKIGTLNAHSRWYMTRPDYSKWDGVISHGYETIGGINFATGIMVDNGSLMVKAYGKVVGTTTRYQIFYKEYVDRDWVGKSSDFLTRDEQDFLAAFNRRANKSFTLSDYQSKTNRM